MTVHVIGAGLAGLAAAVRLTSQRVPVEVHEAARHAGGRCRSYDDEVLGCRIDNGNHLLLSANPAALSYLDQIGAADTLMGPAQAAFPFHDLADGSRFVVRPNRGPVPWWVLSRRRRIPGTRPSDYLGAWRLLTAGPRATVAERVAPTDPLFRAFWEPITLAVMNAPPDVAAAAPLRTVLLQSFARGADWCRPLIARDGLGDSLVDPALRYLEQRGASVRFGRRLKAIELRSGRAEGLCFSDDTATLGPDDRIVLAVPPAVAAGLLPDLVVPEGSQPILNAHFRLDSPMEPPWDCPFLGLLGGAGHWLFFRGDVVSVTVSGADALVEKGSDELIPLLWVDVARALDRDPTDPPLRARIVKERRATFLQTPANLARRPATRTAWPNLVLAGDWTATGLPATIEGAIRSGFAAADAIL